MLHTLTRAFLMPLLALTGLVVLWLAMSGTATQAHEIQSTVQSATAAATVPTNRQAEQGDAVGAAQPEQMQPSAPLTYAIYRLPRQKLRGLFDAQNANLTGQGASIFFTKTVGMEIDDCFEDDLHELIVEPQSVVTYCFIAVNTGSVTLTHHTVVDENLGLVADLPYTLTPYGTENDAAFIPVTKLITKTIASNAVWTAKNDPFVASASDATLVIVPTIDIDSSVVANSVSCNGGQKSLRVARNTPLLYCYNLKNTSPITLPVQTVVDSKLGMLADNLHHPLPAGGSFTITHTVAASTSGTSVVTWTSATDEGVVVTASDVVTVQVPASLELTARASVAGDPCAGSTNLTVTFGSKVVFCYLIHNTGTSPLLKHQLTDKINGTEAFTRTVDIDRWLGVTVTEIITQPLVNNVVWRAASTTGDLASDDAVITITLTPTTIAELFLYQDTNRNNLTDTGEAGIPQVLITLTAPSGAIFTATTNAMGVALFAPLPEAGDYTIDIDQASLPDEYILGQTLEKITLINAQRTVKSIGYQPLAPVEEKIYLPTITK